MGSVPLKKRVLDIYLHARQIADLLGGDGDKIFRNFAHCKNYKNLQFSKLIHKSKPIKLYPLLIGQKFASKKGFLFEKKEWIKEGSRPSTKIACDQKARRRECKRGRTFHAAGRTFTFRDRREEGMMSDRAKRD